MTHQKIASEAPWKAQFGYARAMRLGNAVMVAGTTARDEQGHVIGSGDIAVQTRYSLEKIERALREAGATVQDVVRTRIFVTDITRWEAVAQVHGEFFGGVRPAATMVAVNQLLDPDMLIEIEADALITDHI